MYEVLSIVIQISVKNEKSGIKELVGYVSSMDRCFEGKIGISKTKKGALKFPRTKGIFEELSILNSIDYGDKYLFTEAFLIEER